MVIDDLSVGRVGGGGSFPFPQLIQSHWSNGGGPTGLWMMKGRLEISEMTVLTAGHGLELCSAFSSTPPHYLFVSIPTEQPVYVARGGSSVQKGYLWDDWTRVCSTQLANNNYRRTNDGHDELCAQMECIR